MKPLLASLVLLLLALCRSSAHVNYKIVSSNTESSKSSISFVPPAQRAKVHSSMNSKVAEGLEKEVTAVQQLELLSAMGNFPFFIALAEYFSKVPYLGFALTNGLICDAASDDVRDEIFNALEPISSKAKNLAEMKTKINYECGGATPAPKGKEKLLECYCAHPKNTEIFCLIKIGASAIPRDPKDGGFAPVTCRKQALANLLAAGNKALGKLYDMEGFENRNFANEFGGKDVGAVTDNESVEAAKIFCDALDTKVETAVKELYASDGLYWIAESLLYSIIFGEPEKPIPEICKEAEYAQNEYGKCVCKLDTGFSFCIYKVFAEAFVKEGYLDCTKPEPEKKTFVKDKKPAALPVLAKAKPSSSATASSLLMVPLVAAAALFARH